MTVPKFDELFNPVLDAIRQLGGSASLSELNDLVGANLHLSNEVLSQPHKDGRSTELQYRLAWSRTYLKAYGLLSNSGRGVWHLTPQGRNVDSVDPRTVTRFVRSLTSRAKAPTNEDVLADEVETVQVDTWREVLLARLLDLPPSIFERLAQRILRESGFTQVDVTGRSGDGGIDGTGVVQLGGLLSFPVLFQCKRYGGSVGASAVRDFRGAMVGRTDRGLIITTGTFTRDARLEATRDGAPLIDLVDGEQLLEKLKELRLGVQVSERTVEEVAVFPQFFEEI